jgi:hypothetical protein
MVRPARRRIVEPSFIRPGFDLLSRHGGPARRRTFFVLSDT